MYQKTREFSKSYMLKMTGKSYIKIHSTNYIIRRFKNIIWFNQSIINQSIYQSRLSFYIHLIFKEKPTINIFSSQKGLN